MKSNVLLKIVSFVSLNLFTVKNALKVSQFINGLTLVFQVRSTIALNSMIGVESPLSVQLANPDTI